jgi:SWI/SNF-related matrix-associated actin-dependent regulator of chromatin subfamily A member 5
MEGLNWLIKLFDNGVNGILADEMGLGKTLQTIAFLGYLKFVRQINGPHLIIVPKSVIPNWVNQLKQWCPSIVTLRFHGDKEERKQLIATKLKKGKFEICVTSFEIAIREKAALNKFNWRYLIIDEAHRIKNENSVLSQCVRFFTSQYRLLLTGTPLQNNLHELWALLNFLLPEVFNNAEDFDAWFNLKDGQAETEIIDQLHKVMKPFLLRRLKTDVETTIPPKKEIIIECGMSKVQRTWYKSILTKDINALKGGENMRLLNIVMQLRKCCNHPYLFDGAEPGPPFELGEHLIQNSGKMVLLDQLLKKLKEQGSRVLIFSQMTRMLDILEDYLYLRDLKYCRIDGQTAGDLREQYMDDFNRDGSDKFIFLLSTRAGGLGINLATADTVIIFDSDWNPQADLQAQDRCHRIGQKKPVRVFRFITKDSIEEKVYQRAVKKLYLDAVVIQQGRLAEQDKKLSKTELLGMIKFGAEEVIKSTESTITDEDLDSILSRGEKKKQELDAQFQPLAQQNNLLNFSLKEDANLYEFEGLDYSQKPTKSLVVDGITEEVTEENFPAEVGDSAKQIEDIVISYGKKCVIVYFTNKKAAVTALETLTKKRPEWKGKFCKRNDPFIKQLEMVAEQEEPARRERRRGKLTEDATLDKRGAGPKGPKYHDYQFLNVAKLTEIEAREKQIKDKHASEKKENKDTKPDGAEEEELIRIEEEKKKLLAEGFPTWSRKDFNSFLKSSEKFGRNEIKLIASEIDGKSEKQVRAYSKVFWKRYKEIHDWEKCVKKIEKGEAAMQKIDNNKLMIRWKTQQYKNPWGEMRFQYGTNAGNFSEDEDRFIICMTSKFGYGAWEEIRSEIRNCWEFRFDWFFRSRSSEEIKRRCDTLIRLIEKEYKPTGAMDTTSDDEGAVEETTSSSSSSSNKRKRTNNGDDDEEESSFATSTPNKKKKKVQ